MDFASRAMGLAGLCLSMVSVAAGGMNATSSYDLVIAPDGDDRHPGTVERPLATLRAAQARIRERTRTVRTADIVIRLRGGRYPLTEMLLFEPNDGGTEKFAVRYEAWPGETPVLSGGATTSDWQVDTTSVWTVDLPQECNTLPRHLFVGGRRAVRARSPNAGDYRGIATEDGRTLDFPGDTVGNWSRPGEVELVTLVEWSSSRAPLPATEVVRDPTGKARIAFGRQIMLYCFDNWAGHIRAEIPNFPFYFENAREMLDAPGEWHADAKTRKLRYRPREGEHPEKSRAILPILESLVEVRGSREAPVRNLHFQGIVFADTTWNVPAEGYYPVQAGRTKAMAINRGERETSLPSAAIRFEFARECGLQDCRLERLGGVGVQIAIGCRDVSLRHTTIRDVSGCGVEIGEQPSLQPESDIVSDTKVEDCEISECGIDNPGTVGVSMLICRDSLVAHNHIHHLPYSGVTCGWNWTHEDTVARGNIIANNHIHHVLLEMADGGGIYTLGKQPKSRVVGNHIHDIRRMRGIAGANGIFMDNGSEGWHVEGNIVYAIADAPIRFNTSDTNENYQTWGKNWFGVPPDSPDFPAEAARSAGPRSNEPLR